MRSYSAGSNLLVVQNISPLTSYEKLALCFSEFGLVSTIVLRCEDGAQWATVQYFSRAECEAGKLCCDGRLLDNRRLRVYLLPPMEAGRSNPHDAPVLRTSGAIEMMNHFIGFNQWSHSITQLENLHATDQVEAFVAETTKRGAKMARAIARVRVVCPGEVTVEREALGSSSSDAVCEARSYAQKAAVTNALHAALACLAIVRWPSGKAVVRVLPSTNRGGAACGRTPAID